MISAKGNMRFRVHHSLLVIALMCLLSVCAVSQALQPSQPGKTDRNSPLRAVIEAAILKELREINDAVDRHDAAAVIAHFADSEGMYYDSESGRLNVDRYKSEWKEAIAISAKRNEKITDEITNLYVLPLGPDTALANYILINKTTVDSKTTTMRIVQTDIFVQQNGRWLLRATHGELLPKQVEPVISGLPTDWERSPGGTGDSYLMTVDSAVKHSGNASASLKLTCGSNSGPWGSLSQGIDAAKFKGKRVRLSGWIKSTDVEYAGIWLRADIERHELAFDNMADRPVKGTTDWKRYEVVLDIPDNTTNLRFGAVLVGKGQAWFDDFALETVGPDVPVTSKMSDEERKADHESLINLKRQSKTMPVNLGFENGTVK